MAKPIRGRDQVDLGGGLAATLYDDGSVIVYRIDTGKEVASSGPNAGQALDLGDGRALHVLDGGGLKVEVIGGGPTGSSGAGGLELPSFNEPGAREGSQPSPDGPPGSAPVAGSTTAPPGPTQKRMASGEPVPTNPLVGSMDFGRGTPVDIRPEYAASLKDPVQAPGYMEGSGTYNQARLDMPLNQFDPSKGGLFGPIGPNNVMSNTRYGLGGTGDPTNGSEVQTPQRYITGNPADSGQAMQGDDKWRATGGKWKGGGGSGGSGGGGVGGMGGTLQLAQDYSQGGTAGRSGQTAMGVYPQQQAQQLPPPYLPQAVGGGTAGAPQGGGGAMQPHVIRPDPDDVSVYPRGGGQAPGGGGAPFFTSTVTSNWGQTAETAGKDYIATLFLRSDTPTGVGTPAWSAPKQFWDGLAQEIAAGRIVPTGPEAWAMLREKGYTPETIGGKAPTTPGASGQPGAPGAAGAAGAVDPLNGVAGSTVGEGQKLGGLLGEVYAPIQGGLPGGAGSAYWKLAFEYASQKAEQALEEAKASGVFNGLPTLEAQELAAKIQNEAAGREIERRTLDESVRKTDIEFAFKNAELAAKTDAEKAQLAFDREKWVADEEQDAYARAANPAKAFENELARGNGGMAWNSETQQAGRFGPQQPSAAPSLQQQAQPWQQPAPMAAGDRAALLGATGDTGFGAMAGNGGAMQQQAQPWQQPAPMAAGDRAALLGATGDTGFGAMAGTGAGTGAQNPLTEFVAQMAGNPATGQAFTPGQSPGTGQPGAGNTSAALGGTVRTPGSVNAFRTGKGQSTAGAVGAGASVDRATAAPLTTQNFQQQNQGMSNRMNPTQQMIVGSFGRAGGVTDDEQDWWSKAGRPKQAGVTGSYSGR